MYKLLLCWRYLRSRYIALASIISVMLGVATMIVVNSVMAGFSHEMQKRIHGILSDVVVESISLNGFHDPDARMREIERVAGPYIERMTETVSVPAMLTFRYAGQYISRQVTIVGVPENKPLAGDFAQYLQHPENRRQPSFSLRDGGYDVRDHQATKEAEPREAMETAGWPWRRWRAHQERSWPNADNRYHPANDLSSQAGNTAFGPEPQAEVATTGGDRPSDALPTDAGPYSDSPYATEGETTSSAIPPYAESRAAAARPAGGANVPSDPFGVGDPANPFASKQPLAPTFDPMTQQETGCILGFALCTYRAHDKKDHFLLLPGDDVKLTLPNAGMPPRPIDDSFTVVDLYESKMNEYDSSFVFVPLKRLQELRGMIDPQTGIGNVTSIQIQLKNPADGPKVRDLLRASFPPGIYGVFTWKDKQGPLLAAVQMETAILNVLLFLIIAVAGFGILAIFFMIVVEKTRDIGILKSLGASAGGVMQIFLGYGLSLGIVGSGVGAIMGLLFVHYINEIADLLSYLTGQEVFDPTIYYFYEIPAIINPWTVAWIVVGAISIAVLASIMPARRAAAMHPVEALRYE